MRKVLFLMFLLLLMGLGAAGVKAQVRIGGNGAPNAAAVLDLNATDATNAGTKTLALPRVSLTSTTDLLGNTSLLTGMLVYNTNATLGVGIYYWNGSNWITPPTYTGSTSIALSGNSFQRAALTGDVTAAANTNATTITNGAVSTAKIADNAVTYQKLSVQPGPHSDGFLYAINSSIYLAYAYFETGHFVDTIPANSPSPITWSRIIATGFMPNTPLAPLSAYQIYAPGVSWEDLCYFEGEPFLTCSAGENFIWVVSNGFSTVGPRALTRSDAIARLKTSCSLRYVSTCFRYSQRS